MRDRLAEEHNRLLSTVLAYRTSKPLLVAVGYDLFTWIERGVDTPAALARKLKLDARAVGILLDALVELGHLSRRGSRYANAPSSRRLLVSTSPDYRGSNLKYQDQVWQAWSDLKYVIKEGRPSRSLLDWIHQTSFTDDYVRAMGDVAREPARDLASAIDVCGVERALDIGCGPGVYSAALIERNPRMRIDLLDLPRTLRITRRLLRGHRHASRLRFQPADFLKDSFGREEYDLALISNVTHCENEANNVMLVEKAYRALRPGGRLVIHDYVKDEGLNSRRFVAMLAVHLLVFTGRGNVYTFSDYAGWMRRAGFKLLDHRRIAVGSAYPSVAIIGRKP